MKDFHLEIAIPEGIVFDSSARSVSVKTKEGRVGILADHADYFAVLDIGQIVITTAEGERKAACSGGFMSVSGGEVRIAALAFEYAEQIDIERAKRAKERAERAIAERKDRAAIDAAAAKLARAITRLSVASKK
jgi:F-type H+-transporting ATPase subunit epsilon